jgi:HK97 family phage major capsid protein
MPKMATIKELIAGIEVEREAAEKREQKARKEIEIILASAQQEGRSALSEEEDARCEQLFESIELAKTQQAGITQKLSRAKKVESEEIESEARLQVTHETTPKRSAKPAYDRVMRVTSEERTYTKESDPTGAMFLRDVAKGTLFGDPVSAERIHRHIQEERVERPGYSMRAPGDLLTGGLGGLVVPQYLIDMTAPAVANLRPLADACTHHPLPDSGMSVTIPTITTPASAALQATQLTAVSATSVVETDLTLTVQTAAGSQNVSRQAVERGTGIDNVVISDLMRRYATALDNTLVNQATTGLDAFSNTNTYTSASPTAAEHYTRILGALSQVEKALLAYAKPNLVVMHGRRWYWLQSQLVSTWPFIGNQGGFGEPTGTVNGSGYGAASRGMLPNGTAVCIDDNVVTNLGLGTNQDRIYCLSSDEGHLWEAPGQPVMIRAEQPNVANLGILFVVYGYFAYTFKRYPLSVQNLDGTGLVAPTGF